jgi:hypothetical protein
MIPQHLKLLCAGAALLACGCLPEKRIVWSPDGRWALVRGGDGLYAMDPNGHLSARLDATTKDARWLPDSRGVLLNRASEVKTWDEIAAVLTPQQRAELERRVVRLREDLLAHQGDLENFDPESLRNLTGGELNGLLMLLRDKHGEGLAEKLGDKWDDVRKTKGEIYSLQLGTLEDGRTLALERVLAHSVNPYDRLTISPDGRAVAFVQSMPGDSESQRLFVSMLDGGTPRLVAERTSAFPAWSADSRWLAYAATRTQPVDDSKPLRLGVIARRQVRGEDGALLEKLPEPQELAGTVFQNEAKLHWLADGRVLFAALDVRLPATVKDMPEHANLFAVDPNAPAAVARITPQQVSAELPSGVVFFEVSPDGRHIAVPGTESLAIYDLQTAEVWRLSKNTTAGLLKMLIDWRGPAEFTATLQPEGDRRARVVHFTLDYAKREATQRVLSENWPDPVIKDWLVDTAATQPATQPAK